MPASKIFASGDADRRNYIPPKYIVRIELKIQGDRGDALISTSFVADLADEHEPVHVISERLRQAVSESLACPCAVFCFQNFCAAMRFVRR
jgi:hypothetical protein